MKTIFDNNCIVGEGPTWNPKTQSFWQVDIRGMCLYRLQKGSWEKFGLPQKVGCMAISESGRVLVGMEDGVYWLDTMTLAHQPIKLKGERFNDGKVGPDGAFYLGTVGANGSGAFYRLADGKLLGEAGVDAADFADVRVDLGVLAGEHDITLRMHGKITLDWFTMK